VVVLPLGAGGQFGCGLAGDFGLLLLGLGLLTLTLLLCRERLPLVPLQVGAASAGAGAVVRSLSFTGHLGLEVGGGRRRKRRRLGRDKEK